MKLTLLAVMFVLVACGSTTVLPDVTGLPENEAVETLAEAGWETRVQGVRDDEVEEGHVIRTRPSGGSEPELGSEILVIVAEPVARLAEVDEDCGNLLGADIWRGQLRDQDRTIIIEGRGEDHTEEAQEAALQSLICLIAQTDMPSSVMQRLTTTRALDGMQNAEYNDFHITWTYHPRNGTNFIIEDRTD